ncbi:ABC transporter permease [Candidatus Woesearchaeota archaeon]|nr:ABC transporter permease [Candidatus Woesearchaeota archaeon]
MKFLPRLKEYLNLLVVFTKMEFLTKYQGSFLGFAWYFINPILTFALLYLIFSTRFGADIENYEAYLLIGIVQWNFFQSAVGKSIGAVFENHALIKSINFPREIVIMASVLAALISHLFELVLLACTMIYLKMSIVNMIFILPILFIQLLFALGVSLILSSVVVYVSDVQQAWVYISRLWWLGTPIFYMANEGSKLFLFNIRFNTQFQFIYTTRELLINNTFPTPSLVFSMTINSILIFIAGYLVFNKLKVRFPELI